MDTLLNPQTGEYETNQTTRSLHNAAYVRLVTPLGSWWADLTLGSRLHELQRQKDIPRVYKLAQQYAEQALQPLLDDGRADKIVVEVASVQKGWLHLGISIWDAGNEKIYFKHPVKVL